MEERLSDGSLPAAYSACRVRRARQPDGDRVPCSPLPERAPLTRRQYAYGISVVAVVVLVLFAVGILR